MGTITSELEIANIALAKLNEEPLSALDDRRKAAFEFNRLYKFRRDYLIRLYRWNWAIRRAILAPDPAKSEFGDFYRFRLPADYLQLIGISDEKNWYTRWSYSGDYCPHKVEGEFILYPKDVLYLVYLSNGSDVTAMDPMFIETLASMLAVDMAPGMGRDSKQIGVLSQMYSIALRDARRAQSFETSPEVLIASDWLDARDDGRWPGRSGPGYWN